jgi:hypothetical protein
MTSGESRVIVIASAGRDSELITDVLREAGVNCASFIDLEAATTVPLESVGAMLLAEE